MTPLDSICRICKHLNPATSKELIWLTTPPPRVMNLHLNRHMWKVDRAMIKERVKQAYSLSESCFKQEGEVLEGLWSRAHLKFEMWCWVSEDCFLSFCHRSCKLWFSYLEFEQQLPFLKTSRRPGCSKLAWTYCLFFGMVCFQSLLLFVLKSEI